MICKGLESCKGILWYVTIKIICNWILRFVTMKIMRKGILRYDISELCLTGDIFRYDTLELKASSGDGTMNDNFMYIFVLA